MKKNILVTGSEGFLGQSVCEELIKFGFNVIPFDIIYQQDILNESQLRTALSNCSVCIHLAAVSDLYIAEADIAMCDKINIQGTLNIAKICCELNIRLLNASTCCIYGNNDILTSTETSPVCPTESYAKSKLVAESVVKDSGAEFCNMRLATFYGPKMRKSLATYVFIEKAIKGDAITIHGDGNQTRCYTHVDDVARGIRILLQQSSLPEIVNIASDESCSVNDIVSIIESISGKTTRKEFSEDRQGQIYHSRILSNPLSNMGWHPEYTTSQGLKECYEYLKSSLSSTDKT